MSSAPHPLEVDRLDRRDCEIRCITAAVLIGQIKLTRIHVAALCLARGAGSNGTERDLFTMSKDPVTAASQPQRNQTCSFLVRRISEVHRCLTRVMVEPDGIEPTTSCLQSRRSPS
jgi:hypothetical protein